MKFVGIAAKSDCMRLYALREDGALFQISWELGEIGWRRILDLPNEEPEAGPIEK